MTTTKRTYENLYIIDIDNTAQQIQNITERFAGVVSGQGGEVIAVGLWDKRKLAYEIKGKNEGCYVLMYFNAEPTVCAELDRVMRISDDIIRHMILNIEPHLVDVTLIRTLDTEEATAPAAEEETTVETQESAQAGEQPEATDAADEAPAEKEAQGDTPATEDAAASEE